MLSSWSLCAVLLALCQIAACGPLPERAAAPTATLSNGVVVGTSTQYPNAPVSNNKFLGIPFAQSPPVRFGLPQPASPWQSTLQATSFKTACLQQTTSQTLAPVELGQSEDCLYVNVFTPANSQSGSNKTVMVWIYGGNLQSGDASLAMYDGSSLAANQDVVVVTFGYRLNVFGFSNAPEIATTQQNVGFYDQRLALSWVQNNIYAFGGDPAKTTIFGQSAGGYSVKYLLALPPDPVPFRGAIMESQATLVPGNGTDTWERLASALGCTGTSTLACVRAANATAIQSVVDNQNLAFGPVVDDITFVTDPNPIISSGKAAEVPVMLGTNAQEASLIPFLLGLNGTPVIELAQLLAPFLLVVGDLIVSVLQGLLRNNPIFDLTTSVITSLTFQCDTRKLAETLQSSGYSTWRYFFNASFPNTEVFPNSGAYHGVEIPEVFGTYPQANATSQQKALSVYMQTAWAKFAKNPSAGPGWPEYGSVENVEALTVDGAKTVPASQIDQVCEAIGVLGVLSLPNDNSSFAAAMQRMLQLEF